MTTLRMVDCGLRIGIAGLALSSGLAAQAQPVVDSRPFAAQVAHYGKWLTGAGAVGFTAWGVSERNRGDRLWNELEDRCAQDPSLCQTATVPNFGQNGGGYTNPETEALYQRAVAADRAARRNLFLGQASLVASVIMFVVDMKQGGGGGPDNIPLHSLEISPGPLQSTNVGIRLRF